MLRHRRYQSGEETSEERNPKEESVGHLANPQGPGRDFRGVSNPGVGPENASAFDGKTTGGGRRSRERTATREEESLEGRTPWADSR
jgi:hypothetical protein